MPRSICRGGGREEKGKWEKLKNSFTREVTKEEEEEKGKEKEVKNAEY